jgi:hypothetical protein
VCRPPNNSTPTSDQISYCYPNLKNTINKLKPNVILTVGRAAIESVITGMWLEEVGTMNRWAGWEIPCRDLNCWIIPTYHPSYVLREISQSKGKTTLPKIFRSHLESAAKYKIKPYVTVPKIKVDILYDQEEIVYLLNFFRKKGGTIAFDYETDCLKPDRNGKIITVAVCWRGEKTIAFPWVGQKVKSAWAKLLKSDCPKVAHNLKFEDRWSVANGMEVNRWTYCTMVASHVQDNRKGINSLGFQAFVCLGVSSYGGNVGKFLEQKDSYSTNNIRKADLNQILGYNGTDALLTFELANFQRKKLRLEPL